MSDEEIKKALVCCLVDDCMSCPIIRFYDCRTMLKNETISLLNRQQAEIERLQGAIQEWVDGKCLSQKHLLMIGKLQYEIEQAKSEAIKEFAELIVADYPEMEFYLKKLLADMTGEQDV